MIHLSPKLLKMKVFTFQRDRTRRHERFILNYAHDLAVDSEPARALQYQPPKTPKAAQVVRGLCRYCVDPRYRATDLTHHVPRTSGAGDVEQPVAQVAQGEFVGLAAGDRAGGAVTAAVAGGDEDLTHIDRTDQAVAVR